jgi:16S rRNA processing protein RimM
MPAYYQIGKFVASHGLNGALVLTHSLGPKSTLKGVETLFIETGKDQFLPYFIKDVVLRSSEELLVILEDIDTKEKARLLTPKIVWLSESDFKAQSAAGTAISLLGYVLFDKKNQLGVIEEVIEQPHQLLCVVRVNGQEAMIPVHAQNLLGVDPKKQRVEVDVPEGLLDVYLKS